MRANKRKVFLLIAFSLTSLLPVIAQKNKSDLEKDKKENLLKIQEAEKILSQTEIKKKSTLGQLNAINRQIEIRKELINSISDEISLLEEEMKELGIIVTSMENDLEMLKQEYAKMIWRTYKANRGYSNLAFLFTAESFNQFLMRLKYIEQYSEARKNQVKQIEIVKNQLTHQKASIEDKKKEKKELLRNQLQENKSLITLKNKQTKLISDLIKRQKELKDEMAKRKKAVEKLDKLIADLVRAEIERRNRSEATGDKVLSAEAAVLSINFEKNKTKLNWPLSSGFISNRFGKQPHPVLKGIFIENHGIDIQTNKDQTINTIFEGIVSTVAFVPGMHNVILVKHGEYFSLYARLKSVSVKKGQTVNQNDKLGHVYTDKDGISELQFQIWKNTKKLDPQKWLKTR